MVASGRVPATPLASVQAYVDHRLFGQLPYAGGTFDQPARLMEEMREVAAAVAAAENRERRRLEKRAGSVKRGRRS